ncbi:MAG: amino terminal protease family protein, partial [Bryobacterales bacterium]|nr:amino terminal protease family protein [Bryobacterales bacterium]
CAPADVIVVVWAESAIMRRMKSPPHDGMSLPEWNQREVMLYFVLAFAFSFGLWLPALVGRRASPFYLSAGTFGPSLAALATHRISTGNWRAFRLWSDLPHVLLGIACGGLAVLISAFAAAFFMTRSGFDRWQWAALLQIVTLFGPNLAGGPLGEEAGWRGYALPRLQQRFPPVLSALMVGFVWASWHLPLILAHVYNVTWWQFLAVTMAASVILSFGFNKSGGSTISAVVVHGLYNVATGVILNDFIGKATLRDNAAQHNVFWLAYAGVAAVLCLVTRGQLGLGRPQRS